MKCFKPQKSKRDEPPGKKAAEEDENNNTALHEQLNHMLAVLENMRKAQKTSICLDDAVQQRLPCTICLQPAAQPLIVCRNNDVLCASCTREMFHHAGAVDHGYTETTRLPYATFAGYEHARPVCPVCSQAMLTYRQILATNNAVLYKVLGEKKDHCTNAGCVYVGSGQGFAKHVLTCCYAAVLCPFCCTDVLPQNLSRHVTAHCQSLVCYFCKDNGRTNKSFVVLKRHMALHTQGQGVLPVLHGLVHRLQRLLEEAQSFRDRGGGPFNPRKRRALQSLAQLCGRQQFVDAPSCLEATVQTAAVLDRYLRFVTEDHHDDRGGMLRRGGRLTYGNYREVELCNPHDMSVVFSALLVQDGKVGNHNDTSSEDDEVKQQPAPPPPPPPPPPPDGDTDEEASEDLDEVLPGHAPVLVRVPRARAHVHHSSQEQHHV